MSTETMLAPDFEAIRDNEFPLLGDGIFLNAASYGPLPHRAVAAVADHDERHAAGALDAGDFLPPLAAARSSIAQLLGASSREIALTPNTNVGVNLAAAIVRQLPTLGESRRTILISHGEFPANVYPWLALERAGFNVEFIPTDKRGLLQEDKLLARLAEADVVAVAISSVQFASGYRADLSTITEACRKNDIFVAVDSIQSAGAIPVDVHALGIDVYAGGGQKWLCSPYGTGYAYIAGKWLEKLPPDLPGWLSFEGSYDYTRLINYDMQLWDDARRFEVGTLAFQSFAGLVESLSLFAEIGVDNIWERIKQLQQPLLDFADENKLQVISPRDETHRSGIIALRTKDCELTHTMLQVSGINCSVRENAVRFAPHFYNTPEELQRVVRVLSRSLNQ